MHAAFQILTSGETTFSTDIRGYSRLWVSPLGLSAGNAAPTTVPFWFTKAVWFQKATALFCHILVTLAHSLSVPLTLYDRVEEEATRIQQERLTAEEENRTLRETVFESQGRARAAEAALKKVQAGTADRDKQLRIMTDQNAELLRLLEQEETQTAKLREVNEVRHIPPAWKDWIEDVSFVVSFC